MIRGQLNLLGCGLVALSLGGLAGFPRVAQAVGSASEAGVPENQATAGYLALFARYVQWPDAAEAGSRPFTVGVLGHDPFGGVLEMAFAGGLPNGRAVVVRRVASAREAKECDLVFISREETRQLPVWLTELAEAPVLTISDSEAALQAGAAVVLVRVGTSDGERLRFDVNTGVLARSGLRASSYMLQSARNIVRTVPSGG